MATAKLVTPVPVEPNVLLELSSEEAKGVQALIFSTAAFTGDVRRNLNDVSSALAKALGTTHVLKGSKGYISEALGQTVSVEKFWLWPSS